MYAEILNVTQDKAYYVGGPLEDLYGVVMTPDLALTELGDDSEICLHRVTPVLDRLTNLEPGDSFQVRLFTMDPESRILTNRVLLRGIYWANWNRTKQEFNFERVSR